MSRLEDWQLDLLQKEADHEAGVGDYPFECFDERLPAVPAYWLRCLLEEIRASRASAGGGAEPLKKAYEELRRLSHDNYSNFEKGYIKDQPAHLAASHAYDTAVKVLEECFKEAK